MVTVVVIMASWVMPTVRPVGGPACLMLRVSESAPAARLRLANTRLTNRRTFSRGGTAASCRANNGTRQSRQRRSSTETKRIFPSDAAVESREGLPYWQVRMVGPVGVEPTTERL